MTGEERASALVVDDDAEIRSLVTYALKGEQLEVDTATNGAEALDRLMRRNYRVVVLDMMMPTVSGYDVLEVLRAQCPERLRSTIILTAYHHAVPAVPVCAVLQKPFDVEELLRQVRRCTS
jgi:DNA-binding response OmpR family regulator